MNRALILSLLLLLFCGCKTDKKENTKYYNGYAYSVGIENRATNSIMWGRWEESSTEIRMDQDRDIFKLCTPIPQEYHAVEYLGAKTLPRCGKCVSFRVTDSKNNKGTITLSIRAEDGYASVMTFKIGDNIWRYKCLLKEKAES